MAYLELIGALEAIAEQVPLDAAWSAPGGTEWDGMTLAHPVETWWTEIARVLQPGGHYFSQQVGPGSLRDLSEFLVGPLPAGSKRDPELARRAAEAAGLVVDDLRVEHTKVVFYDIGAVVYLLRVVVWTVPDFSVGRYRRQLRQLHEHIKATGGFETASSRFLVDAHRPA